MRVLGLRVAAISTIAVAAAACAYQPPPVALVGPEESIATLAGEWTGEYVSSEADRSGVITFTLEAGSDSAFGDVIMVPRQTAPPMPRATVPSEARSVPRLLSIKFVRVEGNRITGAIEPYQSPDCGCTLLTVFRGEREGDRIFGEFMIMHSENDTRPQEGTWWAKRVPPATADKR